MSTGQHELPQDSFDDIAADKAVMPHRIDLKDLLPDLFINTDRVPRLVAQSWRAAADSALRDTPGNYTYRGGTIIDIIFFQLPPAAARAKIQDISSQIVGMVARKPEIPDIDFSPAPPKGATKDILMKDLVAQLESEIQKLNREGLGLNPGDEMVRLWAARVMHDLYHDRRSIPLLPQMMELVAQSEISYMPFFDTETRSMGGSCSIVSSGVPPEKYNTGEILRQDMAALFSAAVQLYYLRSRAQEGLVIIPLRVQTLADYDIAGLYVNFLARLAPEISAGLAIEVLGLQPETAPMTVADNLVAISNGMRSCFLDMGVPLLKGSVYNPLSQFPALHACGFSRAAAGAAWQGVAKKFVGHYRGLGLKTYFKDVSEPGDIVAAQDIGFTYIMGTALGGSQRMPLPINKTV